MIWHSLSRARSLHYCEVLLTQNNLQVFARERKHLHLRKGTELCANARKELGNVTLGRLGYGKPNWLGRDFPLQ